ncbi:hypothetical protein [Cellulosimicrobium sp. TH-20]|uniref:hypothetical protein n=1 Tax=Cellulosimicrobium sp. TH-20 TaxID=1980001 RepID=UPI0011A78620|nr:hypothetical protein [Cellulosimicrobium sp. TH-20]
MFEEISVEGLSLVATVYPIGIGLVCLEVFRLKGTPRKRLRGGIYSRASALGLVLLTFPAAFAVYFSFLAALNDDPVDGFFAALIRGSGTLLFIAAFTLLLELAYAARQLDRPGPDGGTAPQGKDKGPTGGAPPGGRSRRAGRSRRSR